MEKLLGIVSVFLLFGTVLIILRQYGVQHAKTISQHVAVYRHTFLTFAIISSIATILFYVFMKEWFIPRLQPPPLFEYLLLLGLACQLIAAWVPDTEKLSSKIHRMFAYAMAFIMPLLLVFILFSQASPFARVIAAFAAAMMFFHSFLFMYMKSLHERFLVHQSFYILVFYAAVLSVAYV